MDDSAPKRKLSDSLEALSMADELNRQTTRHQSPTSDNLHTLGRSDSPRSIVARRLESLDIRRDFDYEPSISPSPSKRTKLRDSVLDNDPKLSGALRDHQTGRIFEARQRSASPTPSYRDQDGMTAIHAHDQQQSRRLRSPPPPCTEIDTQFTAMTGPHDPGIGTWHFSEITGMNIDLPAGDDGEGLNGIGFRPTPQIAQVRRQRRKQQVNDWKIREAREARQKRFEKRQGCKLSDDDIDLRRRSVRFAEAL